MLTLRIKNQFCNTFFHTTITGNRLIKYNRVEKIERRHMMGGSGNGGGRNIIKNLKGLITKTPPEAPVNQKKDMTMIPFRTPNGVVDDKGGTINDALLENHICAYDDQTNLATTALTRSPTGPKQEKNILLTSELYNKEKQPHAAGEGQYSAGLANTYRVHPNVITVVKNPKVQQYFKDNQHIIQAQSDENRLTNEKKGSDIIQMVDHSTNPPTLPPIPPTPII